MRPQNLKVEDRFRVELKAPVKSSYEVTVQRKGACCRGETEVVFPANVAFDAKHPEHRILIDERLYPPAYYRVVAFIVGIVSRGRV